MGDGTSNGAPRRERVALVHDFLLDLRGAERVFLAMCEIWPDADVFTAVYDEEGTEGRFADRNVQRDVPPAAAPDGELVPRAAAVLPGGDRVARPVRLRPGRVQLERLGAGRDPRPRHRARLLLAQPVPLRLERPRPHAGRAPRPGHARGAAPAVPPLAPVGLDRRPAGRRTTSPTRASRRAGSAPTSAASRRSCTRRSRPSRFSPGDARRLLPGAVRADAAQADRPWPCTRSTGCGCRW